jgi:hypothetical protein
MRICFLWLFGSYSCTNIDIVGLHLYVFVHTVHCLPDDDSEFILIEWRRSDGMSWSIEPFLLLDEIYEGFNSSLRAHAVFGVQVPQLDWFFLIEVPPLHKISLLEIDFSVS